jgi:hypothetical protein
VAAGAAVVGDALDVRHLDLLLRVGEDREDADAEEVGADVLEQAGVLGLPDDALVDRAGAVLLEQLAADELAVDGHGEVDDRGALGTGKT